MKIRIILLIILVNITALLAQETTLKVIATSGQTQVKYKGKVNWNKIFVNDSFPLHSKIKVLNNGYICFVDSNLNTYEIRKTGVYKLSFVDSLLTSKNNSVNKNIKKFFLHEILTNKEKFKEMHVLGSVIRSVANKIDVPTPTETVIIDSSISLSWFPHLYNDKYLLYLLNEKDELLYMKEVTDTIFDLDESVLDFSYDKTYKWYVQSLTDQEVFSDTLIFKTVSEKRKKTLSENLEILKADLLNSNSPMNNLVFAKYYEQEAIFSEAEQYYKKAIDISPETPFFWYEYLKFLSKNNLYHKIKVTLEKSPFQNFNLEEQ